jgi:hypothetical protein
MRLHEIKSTAERWILSCDGGGIRGIVTLQCLRALEEFLGASCLDVFDMFAGTSTGAIIAGSLASGQMSVEDLIGLYTNDRRRIFSPRPFGYLHPLVTKYSKKPIHAILRGRFGDMTLADCPRDILITATDTVRSETIYFSAFRPRTGTTFGAYAAVPLRHAIEASLSAPTYFRPHGRFIDGGVGVHNNPAYAAAVEARRYSADRAAGQISAYSGMRIRVLSFGAGAQSGALAPGEAGHMFTLSWVPYVIDEGISQAGYQQSYVCRQELDAAEERIEFYRYQVYLTAETLDRLAGSRIDPGRLALDAVDSAAFNTLNRVGESFGEVLERNEFFLGQSQPPARGYWERYGAPALPADYLEQILADFRQMDRELG